MPKSNPGSTTKATASPVQAEAYDAKGKRIKEFAPGEFSSKTTGQWQLGKMQISNFQTDSSTTVRFDVDN